MKRLFILALFATYGLYALTGAAEMKTESLYDTYRERYLTPLSPQEQIEKLRKADDALTQYKSRPTVTVPTKNILSYFQHLLCHTQSILGGYTCDDSYHPESLLTTDIKNLSLGQIRTLLMTEHSQRRIRRGMGGLIPSDTLTTIAQKYALELCAVGEITHTLNGSTLKQRYDDGGYLFSWGGENLALGQINIMEVLDQLTTSIHHRENMYQEKFEEIGVGQCDNIWVLNYGTPKK